MRVKPKALKAGDRIAIVAPGSAAAEDKVKKGAQSLSGLGFEPVPGKTCFEKRGFMRCMNYTQGPHTRLSAFRSLS